MSIAKEPILFTLVGTQKRVGITGEEHDYQVDGGWFRIMSDHENQGLDLFVPFNRPESPESVNEELQSLSMDESRWMILDVLNENRTAWKCVAIAESKDELE